jgi:tetratricopeptide (TPR) repeat protein
MRKRTIFCLGLTILFAFFLYACVTPGKNLYDTGMQLDSAGKSMEAIVYLEQALEKEPNNKQYQQDLANIKEKLVNNLLTQSSQALGAQTPLSMGAISLAKDNLSKAKEIAPDNPKVKDLAIRIEKEQDALTAEVKDLYSNAKQKMDTGEWIKAYFYLQQIQNRFPNYEDSYQLLRQAGDKGSQVYYEQALPLFEDGDIKGAIENLRKALAMKSDHRPSRELLNTALERDNKDYFIERAKKALQTRQWDKAVTAYERALGYDPENQDLKHMLVNVRKKAGVIYVNKARSQMNEGLLFMAFESYDRANQYTNDPSDFQVVNLRKDLSARAGVTAEQFREQGHYGVAWYWYKKIAGIYPDYKNIFFLTQEMEDQIRRRVQKSIAVFDFSSPSENEDAGIIISNNLITYLFNNASGDIKILERENLKSILEEMKLGQIGVVSGDTAKEMGSVYGIDVAIMGSVLIYNVDPNISENIKSVRYKIGTKIEDNIDYLNWKVKNPNPTKEQLEQAPPAKITIPEYAEKDFKVSKHKKVGFVQISFRIVDVKTGENVQVKTIERKKVAEDETSAGIKDANIPFDPLEIITDTELLQQLTDEVVSELGLEVLRPLQNLEKTYYQKGEKLFRRRDYFEAAESFVDAIFDEKLKRIQKSPMSEKAHKNLEDIFRNKKLEIGG